MTCQTSKLIKVLVHVPSYILILNDLSGRLLKCNFFILTFRGMDNGREGSFWKSFPHAWKEFSSPKSFCKLLLHHVCIYRLYLFMCALHMCGWSHSWYAELCHVLMNIFTHSPWNCKNFKPFVVDWMPFLSWVDVWQESIYSVIDE